MRSSIVLLLVLGLVLERGSIFSAEPEFPLTEDSKPHADIQHGELIKGSYTAKEGSVFPGTEREYTIYLPAKEGSANAPARAPGSPFMVFQDGVIYDAPVVFDNLIAKKDIPPLIGIFIKPGVVPAANENALPRYNRSYEYDSVTDTYSRFLLEEFLPALEAKHGIKLSTDPNDAAIAGNSSGGICAFMAAWHRPDRIRRVFTGVGTFVGIRGADQLPVLIRKYEPKPLRVYLQSGENDNNLYCGDWWMANQMMERSLTWAGYDVNHAWGSGGHNQKHATQIFPDVLRWLWRDYATAKEIKANPRGESKWRGYEIVAEAGWEVVLEGRKVWENIKNYGIRPHLTSLTDGTVFVGMDKGIARIPPGGSCEALKGSFGVVCDMGAMPDGTALAIGHINNVSEIPIQEVRTILKADGQFKQHKTEWDSEYRGSSPVFRHDGKGLGAILRDVHIGELKLPWGEPKQNKGWTSFFHFRGPKPREVAGLAFSPDQTVLYATGQGEPWVCAIQIRPDGEPGPSEHFYQLDGFQFFEHDIYETSWRPRLCVDTEGRLYVATALGIQVCDQAGRVNFIIPTPQQPHDVCFGGKDLSSLFIACGDKIYKRPTKAHGIVSGQMPPIKPPAPKL